MGARVISERASVVEGVPMMPVEDVAHAFGLRYAGSKGSDFTLEQQRDGDLTARHPGQEPPRTVKLGEEFAYDELMVKVTKISRFDGPYTFKNDQRALVVQPRWKSDDLIIVDLSVRSPKGQAEPYTLTMTHPWRLADVEGNYYDASFFDVKQRSGAVINGTDTSKLQQSIVPFGTNPTALSLVFSIPKAQKVSSFWLGNTKYVVPGG